MEITNNNGKLLMSGTTPIGRFVQGDFSKGSDKNMKGEPLVIKSGPNKGQPRTEYFVGIAFQKGVPEVEQMRAEWAQFISTAWPHLFDASGRCVLPQGLSDKWIDGDGYDTSGKAWNTREGFAGHWVLRASSGFAPQIYAAGRYNPADQLPPGSIQLGAFVRINVTVESNLDAQKPGVFVNLRMGELCGMGAPIVRGPDAAAAFSQPAGALPPGATALTPGALPGAPAAPPPAAPPPALAAPPPALPHDPLAAARADGWLAHPSAPGHHYRGQDVVADAVLATRYPGPVAPPPAAPPPAPAAPAAPALPAAQPYHGYAQVAGAPPPPAAPAAPAAPPVVPTGPIMTAAANGVSYEAYKAQGWQDAQLIQAGFMLPANVQ